MSQNVACGCRNNFMAACQIFVSSSCNMKGISWGPDHSKLAPTLGSLGNLHGHLGNYEKQKDAKWLRVDKTSGHWIQVEQAKSGEPNKKLDLPAAQFPHFEVLGIQSHVPKVWDVYGIGDISCSFTGFHARIFSLDHWPSWSESTAPRIEWLLSRWPTSAAWQFQQGKRLTLIKTYWEAMGSHDFHTMLGTTGKIGFD